MERKNRDYPRIVFPNDILPDENPYSELSKAEEVEEFKRLFGLEQDKN